MALSDQERRLLEQLEASLIAEDPKFAETLRGTNEIRIHRKRATLAGLGFILGIVVLIAGVQLHPAVSILGFLLMLASAIVGVNSWQRASGEDADLTPPEGPTRPGPPRQDFMEKLEERWRRQQDGDL